MGDRERDTTCSPQHRQILNAHEPASPFAEMESQGRLRPKWPTFGFRNGESILLKDVSCIDEEVTGDKLLEETWVRAGCRHTER
jgi:hypothetical protein